MLTVQRKITRLIVVAITSISLMMPIQGFASTEVQQPNAAEMTVDLLVARPAGVVLTVLGTAVFVVGLPFSLLGGNVKSSAQTLVVGPAKTTFVRCLGCVNNSQADR